MDSEQIDRLIESIDNLSDEMSRLADIIQDVDLTLSEV